MSFQSFSALLLLHLLLLCNISLLNAWKPALPVVSIKQLRKSVASTVAVGALSLSPFFSSVSHALGPRDMDLSIIDYKRVELCDGRKPIMPGQKAADGLFPACIEVTAKINNPSSETFKDVSVYGFVKDNDAGNSVLPNNPDFRSDAGQYAMIKKVPPGESRITYQFVAAVTTDPTKGPISGLTVRTALPRYVNWSFHNNLFHLSVCLFV